MTDLVAWLTAQLDEDEQVARSAGHRDLTWHLSQQEVSWGDQPRDAQVLAGGKPILSDYDEYSCGLAAMHAVRHDPAAVLADVAAKRAIIEHHDRHGEDDTYLRLLASAYAHRQGYLEEWKP